MRREQALSPVLSNFAAGEEAHRRHMVSLALGPGGKDKDVVDLIAALLDLPMLNALKRMGHDAPSAARLVTDLALSWVAARLAPAEMQTPPQPRKDSQ